jgi:hypothetical protein
MSRCSVCFKENPTTKLKTVGDQTVCSLTCVGLLKSNTRDACGYCKRPVWKDNYYKLKNRYYCSELCIDKIINEMNITKNSKSIKYFHENIFNNNDKYILKNSNQLREEVLRFYKDFQFDKMDNDDYTRKKEAYKNKRSNLKENTFFSDYNDSNNNIDIVINHKIINRRKANFNLKEIIEKTTNNSKSKYYINRPASSYQLTDLKKALTFTNTKEDEEKSQLKHRVKIIEKYEDKKYNTQTEYKDRYEKDFNFSSNNLQYRVARKLTQSNTKKKKDDELSERKIYPKNSHFNLFQTPKTSKGMSYLNLTKNSNLVNSNEKIRSTNICANCGNKFGHISILDRKGNAFCSNSCKDEFNKK